MMRSATTSHISSGKNLLLLALAALLVATTVACDDGGLEEAADASLSATPNPIQFSPVGLDETAVQTVMIENTGSGILEIRNLELHQDEGQDLSPADDWPDNLTLDPDDSEILSVEYAPTEEVENSGHIYFETNTTEGDYTIDIETSGFEPEIFIDPMHVSFPQTPAGDEEWRVAQIHNIGAGTLELSDIFLASGDDDFAISFIEERRADGSFPPIEEDSAEPTSTLEPDDDPLFMRVLFAPEDEDPSHGEVFIENNDTDLTVHLSGNSGDACLEISDQQEIAFGPAAIDNTTYMTVSLRNCSPEAELELYDVSISDDDGGVFSIQPGAEPGALPENTEILNPGEVTTTVIGYSPTDEVDNEGEFLVESNDSVSPATRVPVTGNGVDAQCPVADAGGAVGGAGPPQNPVYATNQDIIHLTGDQSYDPDGTSLTHEWSVIAQPDGSLADVDSPTAANTTFEVDIVGNFQIELVVYDETGLRNCEPAIVEVDATPDEDIHIQLVWSAPEVDTTYGGPDASASIGTDLDIHYVNAAGMDQWGGSDSVYYQRPTQDWGVHGEVRLDIDDLYGENPENINHSDPGMNGMYRIGVHYFSDNGWGAADATVRVFFGANMEMQMDQRLHDTDNFWYVGNIMWTESPYIDVQDNFQETHSLTSAADTGF